MDLKRGRYLRETDSQTGRHRWAEKDGHQQRQTGQTGRHRRLQKKMDTSTDRQIGQTGRTDMQTDRQTGQTEGHKWAKKHGHQQRQTGRTDRQTDRQDRQTDRQTAALTRPFSDILQGLLQLLSRHARTLGEGVTHRVQAGDGPVLRGP